MSHERLNSSVGCDFDLICASELKAPEVVLDLLRQGIKIIPRIGTACPSLRSILWITRSSSDQDRRTGVCFSADFKQNSMSDENAVYPKH